MKVIEKYVSMDGKEFSTADACVQYEERVFNDNTLRMYTEDGKRIPNKEMRSRSYEAFGVVWEGFDAYDRLRELWDEYYGFFQFPRKEYGAYIYVDCEDDENWFDYSDVMAKVNFWNNTAKRFDYM